MTSTPTIQPPAAPGALVCPSGMTAPPSDLQESRRLQQLVQQVEELRDPVARALAHECLQALLALYGEGLARVLQIAREGKTDGENVFARLVDDPLLRGLLLVHGLHPLDLRTRLTQAIEKIRPYMESHGGNVELLSLENDVAKFRLQGACKTCPSSSITMDLALRRAIEEACPDLLGFEVEGVSPAPQPSNHAPSEPEPPVPRPSDRAPSSLCV